MHFDEDSLRASSLTFKLIYRTRGMFQTFVCLKDFLATSLPISHINGLYIPSDQSLVITMADTMENRPVTKRKEDGQLPLIFWEKLGDSLIINDLAPYQKKYLCDPTAANIPFLHHKSLARFPICITEGYTFVINFWSDICDAFCDDDLLELKAVTSGFSEELSRDLTSPFIHSYKSLTSGSDKLYECTGLTHVRNLVEQVAPCSSTVLIMGETGTGKESVADAIHELSPRHNAPFIKVNCGAIPETLLESELFGYEKGAFTGAVSTRHGYFEAAQGGTILLDEIGEMPLQAQVRLLRVLENRTIIRVGSPNAIPLDVRIIASTHADLKKKVREGNFRRDLWYRLSVFPIHVPPLRERKEDISTLLKHFLHTKAKLFDLHESIRIPQKELDKLYNYSWPGNIRELEHVVERAMILARGKQGFLSFEIENDYYEEELSNVENNIFSNWPSLSELENRYIKKVINKCKGKLTGNNSVTQVLGIHYTTLRSKMKQLGLPMPREK